MRMKTLWALVAGLALAGGCSRSPEEHEQKAHEHEARAVKIKREARSDAQTTVAKANDKAPKEMQDARDEERQAYDERGLLNDERQPTAGHDPRIDFASQLRDKLGNDWAVEKRGTGWRAVRKEPGKQAPSDLADKLDKTERDLVGDEHGAHAKAVGRAVTIDGSFDHCDKAAGWMGNFGKIDGVNRIDLNATCGTNDK